MKQCWVVLFMLPIKMLAQMPYSQQKDLPDVLRNAFNIKKTRKTDSTSMKEGGKIVAILPNIGYSPQSRFLVQFVSNIAFRKTNANVSSINVLATYTQNKQLIFQKNMSYFSENNLYFYSTDWRLMDYPQATYGLGMNTSLQNPIPMDFKYLRLYQSALRRISKNSYVGLGYQFDYHWEISNFHDNQKDNPISDYTVGVFGKSFSSGPTLIFLFDNRSNSISPSEGFYSNIVLRQNLQTFGSDENYQTMMIDVRKYFRLPRNSNNVLGFWSYNVFMNGKPPYLDMPSTGWDTNVNTGRGFIQGRFRGKNLMYFEAEYRFNLSKNQLLGGVLFSNIQSVTELNSSQFKKHIPSLGLGLRIRVNKFSRANLAIDYGIGGDGSHNIYFNFGEVF